MVTNISPLASWKITSTTARYRLNLMKFLKKYLQITSNGRLKIFLKISPTSFWTLMACCDCLEIICKITVPSLPSLPKTYQVRTPEDKVQLSRYFQISQHCLPQISIIPISLESLPRRGAELGGLQEMLGELSLLLLMLILPGCPTSAFRFWALSSPIGPQRSFNDSLMTNTDPLLYARERHSQYSLPLKLTKPFEILLIFSAFWKGINHFLPEIFINILCDHKREPRTFRILGRLDESNIGQWDSPAAG